LEGTVGPFPAVAHQFVHAPRTRAIGMRADGVRGPSREIEVAVSSRRALVAPGKGALVAARVAVGGAVKFGLGGKARSTPARIRSSFGEGYVDRPGAGVRQRNVVEQRSIKPGAVLPGPAERRVQVEAALPRPVHVAPECPLRVGAAVDEVSELLVRDGRRIDHEGGDLDPRQRELVIPTEMELTEGGS